MSRNPSGIYALPSSTYPQFPDTTIESADWNSAFADVEQDLNIARPIIAGGTGSGTAAGARTNLQAERAVQTVTNYNDHVWETGSFWSGAGATGAPVGVGNFSGNVRVLNNDPLHIVLEGRDNVTGRAYLRRKVAGTWTPVSGWDDAGAPGDFVKKTGDTMSGDLTISKAYPTLLLNNTDAGVPATGVLRFQKNGAHKWVVGNDLNATGAHDFYVYDFPAGAARLFINSTGNVGINTINPVAKFTIKGDNTTSNFHVRDAADLARVVISPQYALGLLHTSGAWNTLFPNDGSSAAFININGGNVGIGTSVPLQRLTVQVDTDKHVGIGMTGGVPAILSHNAAFSAWGTLSITGTIHVEGGNGNTGIGTTAPNAKLHVSSGIAIGTALTGDQAITVPPTGIVLAGTLQSTLSTYNAPGNATTGGVLALYASSADGFARFLDIAVLGSTGGAAGSIRFLTGNSSATPERMRITGAGNVGIGITPTRRLHVFSPAMKVSNSGGVLFGSNNDDSGILLGADFGVGSIQGCNAAGTAAKHLMFQNDGGNISIGSGSGPASKLDVSGVMRSWGRLGRAGVNGSYGGHHINWAWTGVAMQMWIEDTNLGNVNFTSDYRIKKDVAALGSTWDVVKAMRPISYTQAEFTPPAELARQAAPADPDGPAVPSGPMFSADNIKRWGFIAHELQDALLPTAATGVKDSADHVQALSFAPILAAITKALQEAMTRIEALENA